MIKGTTALALWKEFVRINNRIPTLHEFMDWGYSKPWYYKTKKQYEEGI